MNKKLLAGAVAALAALSPTALAADHGDGPQATSNPALDITDIYTWTDQADATKVDLVLDVTPNATAGTSMFSSSGQYLLNMTSYAAYGAPLQVPPQDASQLLCTFSSGTPQIVSCWLIVNKQTVDYVTGDASAPAGISSANGDFKIFTGPRQDPFFFNLEGFLNTIAFIEQNAAGLSFTSADCPELDATTATTLVNMLQTDDDGAPPVDHFAGFDVLSIVVQLKTAAITPSDTPTSKHPVIGVWASTLN